MAREALSGREAFIGLERGNPAGVAAYLARLHAHQSFGSMAAHGKRWDAPRLILCTETVLAVEGRSLHAIFGSPDDLKFCSSMTLFALAAGEVGSVFERALDRYCGSRLDERTVVLC